MSLKSFLALPYARQQVGRLYHQAKHAVEIQEKIRQRIVQRAADTQFGKAHQFAGIKSYSDFKQAVPIRDYEGLKSYVDLIKDGARDILWPGKPLYFAKTSGTTSGSKYIPITKASISNHINGAKLALLCNIYHTKRSGFVNGKMIFL